MPLDDLGPDKLHKMAQAYALAPKLAAAREQFYAACVQLEGIKAHLQVAEAAGQVCMYQKSPILLIKNHILPPKETR